MHEKAMHAPTGDKAGTGQNTNETTEDRPGHDAQPLRPTRRTRDIVDDAGAGPDHDRPDPEGEHEDDVHFPGHFLMDRGDLEQAIAASGYSDSVHVEASFNALSREEEQRVRLLIRHRDNPEALWKAHLVADDTTLTRLRRLDGLSPNMGEVTRLAIRAATLSRLSGRPLQLPPLLLLGPPGIGKTRYVRALSTALGTHAEVITGTTLPDVKSLTGYGTAWRGAGPGRIARALLSSSTSGPLVFLDEAEKIRDDDQRNTPTDVLLTLLEQGSAAAFKDEYIQVAMQAQHVLWILAANGTQALSRPLLDRLVTITVQVLTPDQQDDVLQTMLAEVTAEQHIAMEAPGPGVLRLLRSLGLRRARLALELALGCAVHAGRQHLSANDVDTAIALLGRGGPQVQPVGFFPARGRGDR